MKIRFTRAKNDVNGNPRYICHFLDLDIHGRESGIGLMDRYGLAIKLASTIGGRKFNNKQFGGGIVFQSYSLDELVTAINRVSRKNFDGYSI